MPPGASAVSLCRQSLDVATEGLVNYASSYPAVGDQANRHSASRSSSLVLAVGRSSTPGPLRQLSCEGRRIKVVGTLVSKRDGDGVGILFHSCKRRGTGILSIYLPADARQCGVVRVVVRSTTVSLLWTVFRAFLVGHASGKTEHHSRHDFYLIRQPPYSKP